MKKMEESNDFSRIWRNQRSLLVFNKKGIYDSNKKLNKKLFNSYERRIKRKKVMIFRELKKIKEVYQSSTEMVFMIVLKN